MRGGGSPARAGARAHPPQPGRSPPAAVELRQGAGRGPDARAAALEARDRRRRAGGQTSVPPGRALTPAARCPAPPPPTAARG